MKIQRFIGLSSALLIVWLGATYFHTVPADRYREQGRGSSPVTGKTAGSEAEMIADSETRNR
jgi:hypothetical protein